MAAEQEAPDGGAQHGDATDDRRVVHNPERSRYELVIGGDVVGRAAYRREGDVLVMDHTVVDQDRREKGLGSTLARGALDDVRANGWRVVPQCPFIAAFIGDHLEYADLVDG